MKVLTSLILLLLFYFFWVIDSKVPCLFFFLLKLSRRVRVLIYSVYELMSVISPLNLTL